MFRKISDFVTEKYIQVTNAIRPEKGQTLVEYALLLALIAIIVITMVTFLGRRANNVYSTIGSAIGN